MPRTAQRRTSRRRNAQRGAGVPMWVFLVIAASLGVITAVGCVS